MVFLVQLFRVPVLRVQTEGSGVFLIPKNGQSVVLRDRYIASPSAAIEI